MAIPGNLPPYLSEYEYNIYRAKFLGENLRFKTIFSLFKILKSRGALIVNDYFCYFQHNTKAQFFQDLFRRGYSVPKFLATNDLSEALEFKRKEPNSIFKASYGVGATQDLENIEQASSQKLKLTPAFFQKKIKGNTYRVHTVGNKVILSLKILTNEVDSRSATRGFIKEEIPKKIAQEIIEVNRLYNIYYSAWDIIIDKKTGQGFLLDCNPGPYIYWIGDYYTRKVMGELAKYFKNFDKTTSLAQAEKAVKEVEVDYQQILKKSPKVNEILDFSLEKALKKLRLRY